MLVKNLVSWAGHNNFSCLPGEHIDLPEKIARARIKAGVAAEPDPGAERGDNMRQIKASLAETQRKLETAQQLLDDERAAHGATREAFKNAIEDARSELNAEIEAHAATGRTAGEASEAAEAEIERLTKLLVDAKIDAAPPKPEAKPENGKKK